MGLLKLSTFFTYVASSSAKFDGTKEIFYIRKSGSTPTGLVWNTNMADVSFFQDTNKLYDPTTRRQRERQKQQYI